MGGSRWGLGGGGRGAVVGGGPASLESPVPTVVITDSSKRSHSDKINTTAELRCPDKIVSSSTSPGLALTSFITARPHLYDNRFL